MKATNFAAANILASIFSLILASTLFQTGEAVPKSHPPTLPNLEGNEKNFYEIIVAPLTAKCADDKFGSGLGCSQMMEKEMLCKNANKIAELYTDLNGIYKQNKKNLVGKIQQAVHAVVLLTDLQELKYIYSDLLSWEVAKPIQDAILYMTIGDDARAILKKAFIDTLEEIKQWKVEVKKKLNEKRAKWNKDVKNSINEKRKKIAEDGAKKVNKEREDETDQQQQDPVDEEKEKDWEKLETDLSKAKDWNTVERRQIVFRFLCIGYELGNKKVCSPLHTFQFQNFLIYPSVNLSLVV